MEKSRNSLAHTSDRNASSSSLTAGGASPCATSSGQLQNSYSSFNNVGPSSADVSKTSKRADGALSVLLECPREFWIICLIKALMSFAYFALFNVLTMYLTEDFGMSDATAGWVYGVHGLVAGCLSLAGGVATDCLGNQRSLITGSLLLACGYGILAWTSSTSMALWALLVFKTCGSALTMPALMVAVAQYSPKESRAHAYSLFYVIMNAAAGLAVMSITASRFALASLSLTGMSTWRAIACLSFATTVLQVMLCASLRRTDSTHSHLGERGSQSAWSIVREVAAEPKFARFAALIFIFVGVRSVFRHLDATFPKYYVRSFGSNSQFELILMVNPMCILLLTPLMTTLLYRCQYSTIFLLGATLSGVSPLALALDTSHLMCLVFVLLLSLGEAIWSPKLYEYSVAIAPRGKEATYSAMSTTPAFLATGLIGGLSGHLVEEYCPGMHSCNGQFLWLLVGLTTITSPALLCLMRPVLFNEHDLTDSYVPRCMRSYSGEI